MSQNYDDSYSITGFTVLRVTNNGVSTTYRANDYFHGGSWYDWAFVEDPVDPTVTYLGKIVGFFRYDTPGFPSYNHIKIEEMDAEIVSQQNLKDETHYAIVIGSTNTFSEDELSSRIVTPFRLTSGDEAYILPVRCIKSPVLVVKNYGSTTSTGHLHVLPQNKWASLFTEMIRKAMNNNENE